MDRCLPGSSSRQCPGKNTEAGCHFHLHKVTCRDSKSLDPNWTNLKEWGRFVSADRIGCKHQIVLQKGSILAKLRKPHWRPVPSSPLTLGNVVQVPATPVCPGSAVSGPLPRTSRIRILVYQGPGLCTCWTALPQDICASVPRSSLNSAHRPLLGGLPWPCGNHHLPTPPLHLPTEAGPPEASLPPIPPAGL